MVYKDSEAVLLQKPKYVIHHVRYSLFAGNCRENISTSNHIILLSMLIQFLVGESTTASVVGFNVLIYGSSIPSYHLLPAKLNSGVYKGDFRCN